MIFIKIRIVCAAFREKCPFYGHSALLRSALVAVLNNNTVADFRGSDRNFKRKKGSLSHYHFADAG